MYETDYLANIQNHLYDLQDLVSEVIALRKENAELKRQLADYDDFTRRLNKRNQEFIGETLKQLINRDIEINMEEKDYARQ